MNNIREIKNKLKNHLLELGFKFFNDINKYNKWKKQYLCKEYIPEKIIMSYINYLDKNYSNNSYKLPIKFYDLIASYKELLIITHSMKSKDILNNGASILDEL